MRRWAVAIGVVTIVGLASLWLLGSMLVAATPSSVSPAVSPARDLKIASTDGVTLAATYTPGARSDGPGILLLHGNGASRAAVAGRAARLSALRYATLAIDFRGHGQSTSRDHSFGLREADDAAAAFRWLKAQQHGAKIGVIGISLGGAASLLGKDGPLPANALVLIAVYPDIRHAIGNRIASVAGGGAAQVIEPLLSFQAYPRYGVWPSALAPIMALPRYQGPVLVIGGDQDRYTPPVETRALFDAARGPRRLWWLRGADHAHVSGASSSEFERVLSDFFTDTLGRPRI